jgi:hypothetical protein
MELFPALAPLARHLVHQHPLLLTQKLGQVVPSLLLPLTGLFQFTHETGLPEPEGENQQQ